MYAQLNVCIVLNPCQERHYAFIWIVDYVSASGVSVFFFFFLLAPFALFMGHQQCIKANEQ